MTAFIVEGTILPETVTAIVSVAILPDGALRVNSELLTKRAMLIYIPRRKGLGSPRDVVRVLLYLPTLRETCVSMTTASPKAAITQYRTKDKAFSQKLRHT